MWCLEKAENLKGWERRRMEDSLGWGGNLQLSYLKLGCALSLSRASWTVAYQSPLSMELPNQQPEQVAIS